MLEVIPSWQNQFETQQQPAPVPQWLKELRQNAFARFEALGFPTRHHEDWRFTPVGAITETLFAPAQKPASAPLPEAQSGTRLVFVNGVFDSEASTFSDLPKGVIVSSLSEALRESPERIEAHYGRYASFQDHAFVALNTAFATEGGVIIVPRGVVVEDPIHLVYLSVGTETPTMTHPRTLLLAGENSHVTLTESYVGSESGTVFTNAVTEIVLEQNAVIDHYKLQQETQETYHIAVMQIALAKSSNFSSHNIAIGGAIARNEANAVLAGEGGECTLNGLYLATGRQLIDNHTSIDHAMPHCNSHEVYKGIINERGRGVFNGKIFVRPDAQKTDAKQTNKTILLSKEAQVNTKPQLEIFADDVKCTHGATVGQLSADALFYLQSRGIGQEEAQTLLTYAFASEIIDRIKVAELRERVHQALFTHLPTTIRPEEG